MNMENTPATRPDPLIDEVRAIRAAISAEHGDDLNRLCEHLRDIQRRYADRVVRRSPTALRSNEGR